MNYELKMMNSYLFRVMLLLLPVVGWAQVPAPAAGQARPVLLVGGVLHVGNGTVVEQAAVGFEKGKITYAGPLAGFTGSRAGYEVIDVAGQHLYPGLILPNTGLGLVEVDAVRATADGREVGNLNPNVRAIVAYNTDADMIPTVRANGVLLAQPTPQGGLISGTSSVVHLDAWNWEDALVKADDGLHLRWPAMIAKPASSPDPKVKEQLEKRTREREQSLQELEKLFAEAAVYGQGRQERENLKLKALRGLYDGGRKLYLHANYAKEIMEGVRFARKAGVRDIVLVGGRDAWNVTDFLKEHNIPVIISDIHALPQRVDEDVDLPYKLPAILQEAGVLFCLDYGKNLHGARNLPFIAGTAAAHGLTKEQALSAVTLNTARIMGIDQQVGSLEVGKEATLVVSAGDLLDMRTNQVTLAFIQGRQLNLTDKQKVLYEKFKAKYALD
jgi:imidazolonepropionase-like amidohydrolase